MPEVISRKGLDALAARKERLDRTLSIIRGSGKIEKTKLLARIELNVGVQRRLASEYLRTLSEAGYCKIIHEYPDDLVISTAWKEPKKKGRPKKER